MKLDIVRVDKELPLPKYSHGSDKDAGLDLISREGKMILPHEWELVKANVKVAIPSGYVGFVNPRSGLALKKGITVLNSDGVIDPAYRGEIGVILVNHSDEVYEVKRGDRVAQLLIQEYVPVELEEKESLDNTERGEGGFGHTGR